MPIDSPGDPGDEDKPTKAPAKEPTTIKEIIEACDDIGEILIKPKDHTSKTNYSTSYIYPWQAVERRKWPTAWMFLVRFYHSESYHRETRYVSDWDTKYKVKGPGAPVYNPYDVYYNERD